MSDMDDIQAPTATPTHPGYIITDTEGTGLFDYKKPADADGQPRMASLTMIFVNEALEIEREYSVFIRPDGWEMTEGATKVNGLTNEFLNEHGVPVVEALNEYSSAIDNGRIMVAHNSQHDGKTLRAELRRAGMDDRFERAPNICTMRALTNICKIPPRGGRGGYKWPSLSEACVFFHMEEFGDHTAKADAHACLALLRKLRDMGQMPEPKVHYAKDRE
jgi:DNA polymerase III subunit epsilon